MGMRSKKKKTEDQKGTRRGELLWYAAEWNKQKALFIYCTRPRVLLLESKAESESSSSRACGNSGVACRNPYGPGRRRGRDGEGLEGRRTRGERRSRSQSEGGRAEEECVSGSNWIA